MAKVIKMETKGFKKLTKKFAKLPLKIQKSVSRSAVTAGAKPVKDAAKSLAPRRFGYLQEDIIHVTKRYGAVYVAIVGINKNIRRQIGQTRDGRPKFANPSKYHHLVHQGTKRGVKRNRYLRKAIVRAKNRTIAIIRTKYIKRILKEMSKK